MWQRIPVVLYIRGNLNNYNKPLIEVSPVLSKEWNEEKNIDFDVNTILANSKERVWWKCDEGHEWESKVVSRVKRNSKCPYCIGRKAIVGENDVETLFPTLAKEFHPYKNGNLKLSSFKKSSAKKVWWLCDKGHEWLSIINTRTMRGFGCPICSNQRIVAGLNDLKTLFPKIAAEISPTGNEEIDLNALPSKGTRQIIWLCTQGHQYKASIRKRTIRGDGCPYCSGKKAIPGKNDLGTLHPDVKKYWNENENGSIENFTHASGKTVNWKCDNGHSWENTILKQVKYNSCPYCDGRMLVKGVNDIATLYPELIPEWDFEANGKEAKDVKATTKTYAFWKCEKGHSWKTNLGNRIQGKGCPYCAGKYPIKGENDLETLFPWLVLEWNYDLNRKEPDKYLPKSNCRVWWKCEKEHSWKALISERTRGTGCPYCRKEGF